MNTRNFALRAILGSIIGTTFVIQTGYAVEGQSASGDGPQVTRSGGGFQRDRGENELRDSATFIESVTTPERVSRSTVKGSDAMLATITSGSAWIYDATTELFDDFDGDGYYTYLRVRFDADSIFSDQYVFARIYLSEDGEFWEEYHVTEDILIEGSSSFDDFEVDTELVSGFPPGLYDVLIELYDADFGDFLDEFGPADLPAFSLLPLEDIEFDRVPPTTVIVEPVVVVTEDHGGGGASDWVLLVALLAGIAGRRCARRKPAVSAVACNDQTVSNATA